MVVLISILRGLWDTSKSNCPLKLRLILPFHSEEHFEGTLKTRFIEDATQLLLEKVSDHVSPFTLPAEHFILI